MRCRSEAPRGTWPDTFEDTRGAKSATVELVSSGRFSLERRPRRVP
jgi:hypothetical protein